MNRRRRSLIITALSILFLNHSYGQGCSDAGVCTISNFKPAGSSHTHNHLNQLKIGVSYGNADNAISAYGSYIEYGRSLNDQLGIDVRLASLAQVGNDISSFGISDLYLNGYYRISPSLTFTLGTKIPLSNSDKSLDGIPLPMDYQSSLGTFDLIIGLGYQINRLKLVAALQQPLTQNGNQFFSSLYPDTSPLSKFQSTNEFVRKGDLILRASYPISIGKKLQLTPSILPIIHLGKDRYTDELGMQQEIEGSQGLTLNTNVYLDYEINSKNLIQLSTGFPFVVREARPDGLTRSFVLALEYNIRF